MSTSSVLALVVTLFAGAHAKSKMESFEGTGCQTVDVTYVSMGTSEGFDVCHVVDGCIITEATSATKGDLGFGYLTVKADKSGGFVLKVYATAHDCDDTYGEHTVTTLLPDEKQKLLDGKCAEGEWSYEGKKEVVSFKLYCGVATTTDSAKDEADEADSAMAAAGLESFLMTCIFMHVAFSMGL